MGREFVGGGASPDENFAIGASYGEHPIQTAHDRVREEPFVKPRHRSSFGAYSVIGGEEPMQAVWSSKK
jgi:hypothetical protein